MSEAPPAVIDRQVQGGPADWLFLAVLRRYDLKLWIGSGDVSAAYLPG